MAAAAVAFASAGSTAAAADRDPARRQYGSAGRARERKGGGGGSDRGVSLLLPTGFISHGVNSDIIHGEHTESKEEKCTVMLCGSTSPR